MNLKKVLMWKYIIVVVVLFLLLLLSTTGLFADSVRYPDCEMVLTETKDTSDGILEVFRPATPENCPEGYVELVGHRVKQFVEKSDLKEVEDRLQTQIHKLEGWIIKHIESDNEQ